MADTIFSGFGSLDFSEWLYGLGAAFIGGGSSAVVSGLTVNLVDPDHFNVRTQGFYVLVFSMFAANGLLNMMSFLRQKPLPDIKTVVTKIESTEHSLAGKVVTTVEETHVEPMNAPLNGKES